MDFLRKYLLSGVLRAPDDAAATQSAPVEGAPPLVVDAASAPAADVSPADTDPAPDAPSAPPPTPSIPEKGAAKALMKRLSEETARRQAAEQREASETAARRTAEEMLQRIQAGKPGETPDLRPLSPPQDLNATIRAEAEKLAPQIAEQKRIYDASIDILNAGNADFQDFSDSRAILGSLGAFESNEFLSDLIAVDKGGAHKIIHKLAQDPEKAAALIGMDSRRRIVELTRMATPAPAPVVETKPAAAPTKVSKAPAPPPPVTPSATTIVDWRSDKASDEEFTKGFNETMAKRAARR